MKKSLVTLLLTAFCFAAFAMDPPRQDTTGRQQDTTKRQKTDMPRKRMSKSGDSTKQDTSKKDTTKKMY